MVGEGNQLKPFPKCSAVHIVIYSASCSHYQKKIRSSNEWSV